MQSFSRVCFRCFSDQIRKCILIFDGVAGELPPTWVLLPKGVSLMCLGHGAGFGSLCGC